MRASHFPPQPFGRRTLDFGLWTLDFGLWTLDFGLWTLDFGLWTLYFGLELPRPALLPASALARRLDFVALFARLDIDAGGDVGQFLVGFFFFIQRLLKQHRGLVHFEEIGPGAQAAV